MREVGQRGHHAAGWRNLGYESVLARAILTCFKPIRRRSDDARDRPDPNLGDDTADNDQPCGCARNERRNMFPLIESCDCLRPMRSRREEGAARRNESKSSIPTSARKGDAVEELAR